MCIEYPGYCMKQFQVTHQKPSVTSVRPEQRHLYLFPTMFHLHQLICLCRLTGKKLTPFYHDDQREGILRGVFEVCSLLPPSILAIVVNQDNFMGWEFLRI